MAEITKATRSPASRISCISQHLKLDEFTDGGAATGYADLNDKLPAGAIVLGWVFKTTEAWAGCTSATIHVGTDGDADAFSQMDAAGAYPSCDVLGEVGGCMNPTDHDNADCWPALTAEDTVRVTITEDDDFTDFTAGEVDVYVYYIAGLGELET